MNRHPCTWLGTSTQGQQLLRLGVTSEDDALVTLQHRTTKARGQFWNLKDQIRSRDSSMKSRLALLHLTVIPILLWAAETWTSSVRLYWAIRHGICTSNPMLHHHLGVRDPTWWWDNKRRWTGNGPFHRGHEIQRHWEQRFDDYWTKTGLEWKTVATDRPKFDAGLKELSKIHEAQSRKVWDGDDATWI